MSNLSSGDARAHRLKRLAKRGLYAITDHGLCSRTGLNAAVEAALAGGATVIQYRDKSEHQNRRREEAGSITELCRQYGALSIINDDPSLAVDVDADGVHIGQADADFSFARSIVGYDRLVGVSCYDSLQRAFAASSAGADYVAFGSFFPSLTKPNAVPAPLELVAQAKQAIDLPITAIGGITLDNAPALIAAGVAHVAVISALFGAADIRIQAQSFTALFRA